MPQPFVLFDNVCKYYQMGETRIAASDHVSFEIEKGEFCVCLLYTSDAADEENLV